MKHIDEKTFEKEVLESKKPVLVDFYASWCGPCMMMAPVLEELEEELGEEITMCKINVDESRDLAIKYGISTIPCFKVIKNGEVVAETIGYKQKEDMQYFIEKAIEDKE